MADPDLSSHEWATLGELLARARPLMEAHLDAMRQRAFGGERGRWEATCRRAQDAFEFLTDHVSVETQHLQCCQTANQQAPRCRFHPQVQKPDGGLVDAWRCCKCRTANTLPSPTCAFCHHAHCPLEPVRDAVLPAPTGGLPDDLTAAIDAMRAVAVQRQIPLIVFAQSPNTLAEHRALAGPEDQVAVITALSQMVHEALDDGKRPGVVMQAAKEPRRPLRRQQH